MYARLHNKKELRHRSKEGGWAKTNLKGGREALLLAGNYGSHDS